MNCILCNSDKHKQLFIKNNARYVKCKNCGMIFQDPMPLPSKLNNYYKDGESYWTDNRHTIVNNLENLFKAGDFYIEIIKKHISIDKKTKVLDFGCGTATFLYRIKPFVNEVRGIDLSEWSAMFAKDNFDIEVDTRKLEEITNYNAYFDFITMWQTLEHISSPVETIECLKQFLKPRGYLIIGVPNIKSFFAKVLGKYWSHFNADEHVLLFNTKTLAMFMDKMNFDVVKTYKLAYSFDTELENIVNFSILFTNRLIKRIVFKLNLHLNFGPFQMNKWKKNPHLVELPMGGTKDSLIMICRQR